ncbi:MAG: response regulator [Anaerolineales bacterium]|nr:response regulator [Anaerolineales bacterium]
MLNNTLQETVKIAYVEDEPSIAQLLVSGLGLFGIEVKPVFMSAEDLLTQVDSPELEEIDLFFFDIRLPKMTGMELAGKLREHGEKRPFVLVSAWPAPPSDTLQKIGAEFLPKPFDFPDVVQTIQKLATQDKTD